MDEKTTGVMYADDSGQLIARPRWVPDEEASECFGCRVDFSVVIRRHHCRACGQVFCDTCSSYRLDLLELGYDSPQRVCESCYSVKRQLMRACIYHRYTEELDVGGTLKIANNVPRPNLHPDAVLVRVHAASINPVDWKMLKGNLSLVMKEPPVIPGFDLAGTVEAVGSECKRLHVGDHVYAMSTFRRLGAFAEYCVLPENLVALKPESLTFAEAATLPLVGLTTYQSLVEHASLDKDDKVLVLGGSGGNGTFAIQLAKRLGASHVACTCSERNFDLCRSLGADQCIDYRRENWWEQLAMQNFDVVYDCVGGPDVYPHSAQVLKKSTGRLVTICGDTQTKMSVGRLMKTGAQIANRKFWHLFGYPGYDYVVCKPQYSQLDAIASYVEEGSLKPVVEKVYTMDDLQSTVAFFNHIISGRTRGKIALAVDDKANLTGFS